MIVDLSFPHSRSVNEGISKTLCSLSYSSVDTAVSEIMKKGRGTTLSKNDLKDAYRIVPVHPQDMKALAITWQGSTYIERALPFGLRSAPKIFTAVSDMITWPLHCRGLQHQIHYLVFFCSFPTQLMEMVPRHYVMSSIFWTTWVYQSQRIRLKDRQLH